MVRTLSIAAVALLLVGLVGCGSSNEIANLPVEERYSRAKALFDEESYLDAINEFTVVTLQYQGSQFAADAQFYFGECRYNRHEFLLAGFEYGVVKRSYPASPRVPEAQYKLAMSYYMLSPKSSLDQQYTRKAVDEFQTFVEYYPKNPLADDASAKIRELNTKLAKKLYDAGLQYVKLERYKAAIQYFDNVIEKYHDTEFAPLAFLDKTEILIDRKRYSDASLELARFYKRFANSVLRARADALRDRLAAEWNGAVPQAPPIVAPLTSSETRTGDR